MSTEIWVPWAIRLPLTTGECSPREDVCDSLCEHVTAGFDSRNHLQNVKNGSSTHLLIRVENGRAVTYQFISLHLAAWGNGRHSEGNPFAPQWVKDCIAKEHAAHTPAEAWRWNINHRTVSIEHEAVYPTPTTYTGPLLAESIRVNKWIADAMPTVVRTREHVIGHYQIGHVDRPFCPGGPGGKYYPFDRVIAEMNRMDHFFPETNQHVRAEFYNFWTANGGLPIFGYPIRPETSQLLPNGAAIPVQSFERCRMELHPDGGVKLGLVEAERLNCLHQ